MNKQTMIFTLKNIPQYHQETTIIRNNFHCLQKPKNIEVVNHQIVTRETQILPEINSPYLRKTVQSLFLKKNHLNLSPSNQKSEQKFLIISQPLLQQSHQSRKIHKIFNTKDILFENIKLDKKQIAASYLSAKLGKNSFKQSQDIRKSEGGNHNKIKKSKTVTKIPTETSQQSHQNPQQIFQKLKQSKHKDCISKVIDNALQPSATKKLKPSINIVKKKLAQQLYSDERQQIKLIKMHLTNINHLNIGQNLQVKNYVNFPPNIINIQSL